MPSGTNYIPSGYPLDASKVQGAGQGVTATCTANTTTNLDLALSDDMIITGLQSIVVGATLGDYIVLQVLVSGVTVATPIPGPWYVPASGDDVFDLAMPMKLSAGMTLRLVYHATVPLVTPEIAVNYKLWKVLT